ncbi:leukocyte immunoglobulin-like receptor subfamily A member 5 isoform X2 [Arvicanthis niloticus]|uniref:leukocyte immunoglobulin-like receptor subfamily A member 5 isoform X2 n=1 Tax=Arvicanthis niloticus TaxID=61156 RepID=UPI00402BCD58
MVSFICGFEPAGGNIMITILTILFYTGLNLTPSTQVHKEHSDMLELIVTGVYSKPSLSVLPSSVVTPGENMTFQCVSFLGFGTFILTEEGESKLSWTHDAHRHPNGYMQALFPMGPMFPSRKWKFRCYGYDKSNPHVWSVPSNPEELKFSENIETTNSSLNISDPQTGSSIKDHTVENLTRISMAVLILAALGILLFQAQHSQRKKDTGCG